ncbi:acetate--CoA ligase family protein [Brevibacillus sp. SYP-B805]|uniref:acetate--CoA ligase family protein n=1 Tax=Brevibacillus sp. SYP-B805 TaxID=1578199 RepID=UPI0013EA3D3C|nr:acetate--CoA ligase family protein [Brevibacillus sp. SYP-B805]NGQ95854.1 acetate--CoA ligase family protein [Brevibacillus sp. SYP-B805]
MADRAPLDKLLRPRSIAVVGASEQMNYGGRMMNNLITHGYAGSLYPINPKRDAIFGRKAYSTLLDVPDEIDLAVVIVKAELVEAILRECEEKRVGAVLIISAGFREQGTEEGILREHMVKAWSERTGIPVCGPNCLGVANSAIRMWANSASSLGDGPLPTGSVGLISHSGATAFGPLLNRSKDHGLGYRYIVTTGNEAALRMTDVADYMLDDPDIKALCLFIEGIKDGQAFIRLADKALRLGKPLIALKIGESEIGRMAAASHTASMTGNQEVFAALCRQKGVLLAKDYDECIQLAMCCQYGKPLMGDKIVVLSHSGGIGGFVGDKLGMHGLQVPPLARRTTDTIGQVAQGLASVRNPLDLSGTMQTEQLLDIVRVLDEQEEADAYVFATHGKSPLINRLHQIDKMTAKPVYLLWTSSQEDPLLQEVRNHGIPLFFLPDKLAATLSHLQQFRQRTRQGSEEITPHLAEEPPSGIPLDAAAAVTLNEHEGKRLLGAWGIATPDRWYFSREEAIREKVKQIDFAQAPFVAKIVSSTITHKSDHGGVLLGVSQPEEVIQFFQAHAQQEEVEGILLEAMVKDKIELILGSTNDPQFGPVVMVGLGGIYTELFKLVTWRIAPLSKREALRMLEEIPGLLPYLQGFRNMPKRDVDSLIETISTFSQWVYRERDRIESVEINPLAVLLEGRGTMALDCVIQRKLPLT